MVQKQPRVFSAPAERVLTVGNAALISSPAFGTGEFPTRLWKLQNNYTTSQGFLTHILLQLICSCEDISANDFHLHGFPLTKTVFIGEERVTIL